MESQVPLSDSESIDSTSNRRRWLGLSIAAALFALVWCLPMSGLQPEAHRLAAIFVAVIALWILQPIPMPVSALMGACLCVILKVGTAERVFSRFADPIMFLFIGSFILARAIFVHGVDRQVAWWVLSRPLVAGSPSRILFAFGGVTAALSAWMSNTAITAMMFPIGLSLLAAMESVSGEQRLNPLYATAMMLITSFAASVGGLATPVGTPPNVIGLRFLHEQTGVEIPFFNWMLVGVPVVVILYLFMFAYLNYLCPAGIARLPGNWSAQENSPSLRRLSKGQRSTFIAFGVTVFLWVFPGALALCLGNDHALAKEVKDRCPEAVAALIGSGLLFLLPGKDSARAITWSEAAKIDWGIVLIYGGGVSLGGLANDTKLAEALGTVFTGWIPGDASWSVMIASTVVAVLVSETTSNTASATIVVPMAISIAKAANVDPLPAGLGATLGASLGFMLPVSTPCNAIVFGSGKVPIFSMIRFGLLLDLAGIVVVIGVIKLMMRFLV